MYMLIAQANSLQIPGSNGTVTTIDGPTGFNPNFTNLASLVNAAQTYILPVAGILLFLFLIWGGFDFLTAMGDPKKAEAARNKITYALIGFVIIFGAYWIVQLVTYLFRIQM